MHVLIVGGTGMLRGITEHCARTFTTVSVLAQSESNLAKLEQKFPGKVEGLCVDYHSETDLRTVLRQAVEKYGRFDMAVVWIPDDVKTATLCIAEYVGSPEKKGKYVHVRSSTAGDPASLERSLADIHAAKTSFAYQDVILGFVKEGTESRWLTHNEITAGVLKAMNGNEPRTIVGTIEPWADRPAKAAR